MDYEVGTCGDCGGKLIYISCFEAVICDTCSEDDYIEDEMY